MDESFISFLDETEEGLFPFVKDNAHLYLSLQVETIKRIEMMYCYKS